MAIIVLTLVIPLLGLAILYADSERQQTPLVPMFGLDTFLGRMFTMAILPLGAWLLRHESHRKNHRSPQSRAFWASCLSVLGVLSIAIGVSIAAASFVTLVEIKQPLQVIAFPLILGIGVITSLTGWQASHMPRSWPADDEDQNAPEVIEKYCPLSLMSDPTACRLRSGAWVMVLFPLLYVLPILGVFGAFLIVAIAMALSAWLQSRRAFQSQLLWLITIAIRNQLPLADEFRNLAINTGVKRRLALNQAAQDLEHGDTLSMALERSRLLPASMISAIRVSEGGAHYEEALRRLATYSTERLKSYGLSRLSEVFVQVVTILSAWVFIVGFLMFYIIPKFAEIFKGFNEELPRSTRVLIDFSDNFMFASSAVVFWVGIGILLFCWQTLRHIVGWSSLSLPAVMYWFPRRDAPEVLRALAGITTGMTPLPQQILQLTNRPGRPDLGARYHRISESIRSGQTLSHSLHAEGLLTPLQCEAVAAGERGGQLSFILFSLADAIDQRELRQSADWAEMLKPFVVVVSGLVTGFIVFAMFVPLVKLISRLS